MTHAPLPPSSRVAAGSRRGLLRTRGFAWWLPLLIAAVAATVTFVLTDAQDRTYESRASLLAPEQGELTPEAFVAEIDSDAVYEQTITTLQLDSSLAQLRDRIDVSNTGVVIEILARGPSPREAQSLARVFSSEARDPRITDHGSALTVHRQALTPDGPITDKTARDTAAAAAGGLLLGMGLAIIVAQREPSQRHRLDVAWLTGWPVLAEIPFAASGNDVPPDTFAALQETLAGLRQTRSFRTLLVTGVDDGDGASTVTVHLALAAARAGLDTTLVDADLVDPAVHTALGIENGPGLRRSLEPPPTPPSWLDPAEIAQPVLPLQHLELPPGPGLARRRLRALSAGAGQPDTHPPGTHTLGTDPPGTDLDTLLRGPRFAELLQQLRDDSSLVVINSPPLSAPVTPFLAQHCDAILVVVNSLSGDADQIQHAATILGPLRPRVIGTVVTRTPTAPISNSPTPGPTVPLPPPLQPVPPRAIAAPNTAANTAPPNLDAPSTAHRGIATQAPATPGPFTSLGRHPDDRLLGWSDSAPTDKRPVANPPSSPPPSGSPSPRNPPPRNPFPGSPSEIRTDDA
ncbi:MAG: Chromosome partitioning ATPase, Mrp family, contains Fe-S cluster [Chloroflexi bacterium]|nr:MAG: Chromosome partitioning ATPase, Mrp family, contains Fe-S cluster [Chloroflexota bacterium]